MNVLEHAKHLASHPDDCQPATSEYGFAQVILRLAQALRDAGLPEHFVNSIANGE